MKPEVLANGWRIFSPATKTYYASSESGTSMAASRESATVFDTAIEAIKKMDHWAFAACRLERPDGTLQ